MKHQVSKRRNNTETTSFETDLFRKKIHLTTVCTFVKQDSLLTFQDYKK